MMVMKAVAAEVVYEKADDQDEGAEAGYFYPFGHFRCVHGDNFLFAGKDANYGLRVFDKTGEFLASVPARWGYGYAAGVPDRDYSPGIDRRFRNRLYRRSYSRLQAASGGRNSGRLYWWCGDRR